ncbi:unnamed protein product [Phytophthora fragariaefolia]|uniref:Unnamed protein product n=1 Tax=Phytophthora fragariaefolia TaxID=1490495 RepID=A0A9W6UA93_9STRA|nr:unnamed protein product [Phytophthora fragariaefolia]
MIQFLDERLGDDSALTTVDLFGWIVKKLDSKKFEGPAPLLSQLQEYVKKWHKQVKLKTMQPVTDISASHCCGTFFPLVYFCTSPRTSTDINWCYAFVKRVMWETFMVQFSPKFIMTDADNAQYNTCSSHIRGSKILMCWFHVCQNVKARMDGAKLDSITSNMIFRGLNDMHFARDDDDFKIKRAKVHAEWNDATALSSSCKSVAGHIIGQWILHPRFSQWQAYHTPPGYASTNNPLEQYHWTLKLVNKSAKATPTEMVQSLDRSRLIFVNMRITFSSTPIVSDRLEALYNLTMRKKELEAISVQAAGDQPAQFVRVRHRPFSPYGNALSPESDGFYVDAPRQKSPRPFAEVVNETRLHASRQSPHRSAPTIRSGRTYEITVPSIPAGAAADTTRSVSNVTSESGLIPGEDPQSIVMIPKSLVSYLQILVMNPLPPTGSSTTG